MLVELHHLLKLDAVKIGKEVQLGWLTFICLRTKVFDDVFGVNLLLDIDGHCRHFQVFRVLFVFAFPNKLWVKGRVTRV
ncbi:hypothetical protein ES703_120434 [subsurface metagenome]